MQAGSSCEHFALAVLQPAQAPLFGAGGGPCLDGLASTFPCATSWESPSRERVRSARGSESGGGGGGGTKGAFLVVVEGVAAGGGLPGEVLGEAEPLWDCSFGVGSSSLTEAGES